MRVLSYIDCLNKGGMETLIGDVAQNITNCDFELYIVSGKGGELEGYFKNSNARYFRFNRKKAIDFKLIKAIRDIIKSEKIDIIHSHNDISGLYGYLASIGLKKKMINTIHGYPFRYKEKTLLKYLIKKSERNISVSHSFLRDLEDKYKIKNDNFEVLYNGVDFEKFNQVQKGSSLKRDLNIESAGFVIGMTGNFTNVKDQITLCKAMKPILKNHKNVKLLLIGGKSEKEAYLYNQCYNYCEENDLLEDILFLGKRDDIPELLQILDLFILSTNTDTFGIAAIEAMYMNIPCVLTKIDTMVEISDNGKNAIFFNKNDSEDLADKIEYCINNNDKTEVMAEYARKWVVENYDIKNHIKNLKYLYNKTYNL